MRTTKNLLAWILVIMVLMGGMSALAQETDPASGSNNAAEAGSATKSQEVSADEKQPKAQVSEEAPDKEQSETEGRVAEKPETEKQEAKESTEQDKEETQADKALPEQVEPDEAQAEDEQPQTIEAEVEKTETEQSAEESSEAATPEAVNPDETQTEDAQTPIERSVTVRRIMPDVIRFGETFQLKATLVGFEGDDYTVTWQYLDGRTWTDVDDEMVRRPDALTLEVYANDDDVNYDWRILVSIV